MKFWFALPLLLAAVPADATQHVYSVGSFDCVRVDGPFAVELTVGASPRAIAEGDDTALDGIDIRVDGTTLTVRKSNGGWGERPHSADTQAPVIRLQTLNLRSAAMVGGGKLTITGQIRGQRLDLVLTGAGEIAAPQIATDQLSTTVYGNGVMTLGGRAQKATLNTSGPGTVEASALSTGDLVVRLDGTGATRASARTTAAVTTTGIGAVTIYGKPACTVKAIAGGPISCGKVAAP